MNIIKEVIISENAHVFEFKQNLPVQLHALPVDVFNGHYISLEEYKHVNTQTTLLLPQCYSVSCNHDNRSMKPNFRKQQIPTENKTLKHI